MNEGILLLAGGVILAIATAFSVTLAYRSAAVRGGLLDRPVERSSHAVPTPTGGGLGIVAGCGLAFAVFAIGAGIGPDWVAVLAGAGLLAVLGFADDRFGLPVLSRLVFQLIVAALFVVFVFGGLEGEMRAGAGFTMPLLALAAMAVLVGLTNFFNFMDGIDGLAGAQGVFVAGGAALLIWVDTGISDSVLLLSAVAAGCLGFLGLNWPPARIFMGDTGSLALGFLLAGAPLVTALRGELQFSVWLILWALFITDAGLTLSHRMLKGLRPYEAHRDHAYQRLARHWGSHRRVTLLYTAINVLWLLPLAALARYQILAPLHAVVMAYIPVSAFVAMILLGVDSTRGLRSQRDARE